MSKVDRNRPKLAGGSEARCTRQMWDRMFPDDAACLDYLVSRLYPDGIYCPKCKKITRHHRENGRPSYECQFCGHHEHPMVGTIFENSATSLKLWFDAIYIMASTRCGISAKQLERELGVTYKTAWRMFNKIRSMLGQDDGWLSGTVEADEMFWGGQDRWRHVGQRGGSRGHQGKTPVLGVARRKTSTAPGQIRATVASNVGASRLIGNVKGKVLPASTVYTDEWRGYNALTGQ